jgi:hypothetical protein
MDTIGLSIGDGGALEKRQPHIAQVPVCITNV